MDARIKKFVKLPVWYQVHVVIGYVLYVALRQTFSSPITNCDGEREEGNIGRHVTTGEIGGSSSQILCLIKRFFFNIQYDKNKIFAP